MFLLKRKTISIPDRKIQGFNPIPPPSNRLALRKFINSLSLFRTNIPNFSELAADLTELVNKTDRSKKGYIPFHFTAEHLKQFERLKEAASNSLPLYQTDFSKPIYCFSDSSRKSASFVAFQLDTDDAPWFEGSKLSDSERSKKVLETINSHGAPEKNQELVNGLLVQG